MTSEKDRVVSSRARRAKTKDRYTGDVDPADAAEQARDWADDDTPADIHPDADVPEADAWEQALPAGQDEDDRR